MRSTVAMNNVSIKTWVPLWHAKSWPVLCSSSVPIANSTEFMEESWIEGSHMFLKWCLSLTRLECINHMKVELSHMEALVCQHANTQDSKQEHSTRFLTFQNYFWGYSQIHTDSDAHPHAQTKAYLELYESTMSTPRPPWCTKPKGWLFSQWYKWGAALEQPIFLHRELFNKLEWGTGILMATSLKFLRTSTKKNSCILLQQSLQEKARLHGKWSQHFFIFSRRTFQGFFRTVTFFSWNVKIWGLW